MSENKFQMAMSSLLIMESQSFIKFWEFFGRLFKHDTEIIQSILLIEIFNNDKGSIFFINNLIFSLLLNKIKQPK